MPSVGKPTVAYVYTTFQVLVDGPVATLSIRDRRLIEPDHVQRLQNELIEAVRTLEARGFVADFTNVEFLSSAVLGAVIAVNAAAGDRGANLALCGLSKDILKVFKMMRLDTRLSICKTLADAKEQVR